MAVLSFAEVRKAVEDVLVGRGFDRSRYVFELFGADTDSLLPRCVAVGVGRSTIEDFDGRESYGTQGESETRIKVKTAYRLRGDAQTSDLDGGLDHELAVLQGVLAVDVVGLDISPRQIERTVRGDEWLISTLHFRAWHRIDFG